MNDKFMKQFTLLNKIWVMEAFLSFGKYNNFQSDNVLYNSEYGNFSYNFQNHWRNEYLAFQLCIQMICEYFWYIVPYT